MLSAREAVAKANQYLRDLVPAESTKNLLVEEVEMTEDEKTWLITLGFDAGETDRVADTVYPLFTKGYVEIPKRTYKQFCVDATSGEVMAMRIRKV